MKKISRIIALFLPLFMVACNDSANEKFVGTWQDASSSMPAFVISKTDKGLVLQSTGESSSIAVQVSDNTLTVVDTKLTLDEQKHELSMPGLFGDPIVFKKVSKGDKQ